MTYLNCIQLYKTYKYGLIKYIYKLLLKRLIITNFDMKKNTHNKVHNAHLVIVLKGKIMVTVNVVKNMKIKQYSY